MTQRMRMIGDRPVGPGAPVYVIGEIGINHNGDVDLALKMNEGAAHAGADGVKFQKRTPELCTPRAQWDVERDTPWGRMKYIDYRRKVELSERDYKLIDERCRELGIQWFTSCWDEESVAFTEAFDSGAGFFSASTQARQAQAKIASRVGRVMAAECFEAERL